jgi:hypothetical protein
MRSKSEETRRAAGEIENVGAPDGSDYWEGVLERSVRMQPCGPSYIYQRFPISLALACIPGDYKPRSSRSCASIPVASEKRGVISNSNGIGRLQKPIR